MIGRVPDEVGVGDVLEAAQITLGHATTTDHVIAAVQLLEHEQTTGTSTDDRLGQAGLPQSGTIGLDTKQKGYCR
jgi:hypothetical protein